MADYRGTYSEDNHTGTDAAELIYGYPAQAIPPSTEAVSGLYRPLFATAPKGDTDHLYVVSQGGKITVHDLKNPSNAAEVFLDVGADLDNNDEAGLLGFTFHPDFAKNGKCYANYTERGSLDQVIVEYTIDLTDTSNPPAKTSQKVMTIDYPTNTSRHRAGWIEFGPDDMLYIATGDGYLDETNQPNANSAQTLQNEDGSINHLGKILRIQINEDGSYSIPSDNPTKFQGINDPLPQASEIWAIGLRNPWRASFTADHKLIVGDVGDNTAEEINIVEIGKNYGWRRATNADGPQNNPSYTDPYHSYVHSIGRSVTAGYVYSGEGELKGKYIFGDFIRGKIFAMDLSGETGQAEDVTNRFKDVEGNQINFGALSSFALDGQGNLYAIDYGDSFGFTGKIYRLSDNTPVEDAGDALDGAGGNDTIWGGGGGDDTIYGGADSDHVYGEAGNDRLYGGNANGVDTSADTLTGGAGSDIYYVDGSDTVIESGADNGQDQIHASGSFTLGAGQAVELLQAKAGAGDIDLTGNELAQDLIGNEGDNRLDGRRGADTLKGLGGDDTYVVYSSDETVDETITDDNGHEVDAGGIDTVESYISYILSDYLENLTLEGAAAINGTGNALANTITGNSAANIINGGAGADTMEGRGGNDTYRIDNPNDVIVEGAGGDIDTLIASASYTLGEAAHVEILKADGAAAINLTGNDFANTFHGNSANNSFDGRGGQDTVVLTGQRSDYEITLSDNILTIKDKRANGDGTDTVTGAEIFQFSNGKKISFENILNNAPSGVKLEGDVIRENSKAGDPIGKLSVTDDANDRHQFALVDNAGGRFSLDADGTLRVANGVLLDYEQAQKHTIEVTVTDALGEKLTKRIDVTVQDWLAERAVGSALADVIKGGYGNDVLSGVGGNDLLSSGIGNDRLIGGLGKDTLTGGTGRDVFVFDDRDTGSSKSRADYITDFSGRQGDKLDLKLVDANASKRGDQKFTFIGKNAFSKAGEVRYEKTKKDTYVYLNTDNDKAAEAVIKLKGSFDLQKSWFVL
jgi:Ca2+-binding RTX toxin-like protein